MSAEHRSWQRATALRKVEQAREEASVNGLPFTEGRAHADAARYVGTTTDQVARWAKGHAV
ncbi:MAG TPA: hypothetical protein VF503_00095 [Sphingobium sp.]|uniref:hypothetical protein n=1 Tax=Sphingobium sp. TaxID=1912891 RepID=UPI002ED11CE5